jgi:uncharacterized membrane protein
MTFPGRKKIRESLKVKDAFPDAFHTMGCVHTSCVTPVFLCVRRKVLALLLTVWVQLRVDLLSSLHKTHI